VGECPEWGYNTETYTHTWNADDIGRARAPHCEVYALKDPIRFATLFPGVDKMYGSGMMNWYCKKEGCWESGKYCGRHGGFGVPHLGCFKDSVLYGGSSFEGKRYWAGCCSGEIEKEDTFFGQSAHSYWYRCK